jgi:hypothetical protein
MMRHRKPILILILLFACMGYASASFAMRPYVSTWFGASLCHPTAEYLKESAGDGQNGTPFFRTSSSFGFDAQLLEAMIAFEKGNAVTFGAGFSYLSVSESLPYGRSVLKPYSGFGFSADIGYRFNNRFDLDLKYRYLFCSFTGTYSNLIVQDIELAPAFVLTSPWALDMSVSIPLTLSFKADSVSLRAAICFQIALDSRRLRSAR